MTRWIIAAIAAGVVSVLAGPGCSQTGIGDPCIPDAEYQPGFGGFSVGEVSIESKSFSCLSRLCLVNHFQGRVSCPWGQIANPTTGASPAYVCPTCDNHEPGGPGCFLPGTSVGDSGTCTPPDNLPSCDIGTAVPPQLTGIGVANRTAGNAVYCSCRCSNQQGQTNDGNTYCSCPEGFSCEQLVASISSGTTDLSTGGYCVKTGTIYSKDALTPNDLCDATQSADPANAKLPGYCPQL